MRFYNSCDKESRITGARSVTICRSWESIRCTQPRSTNSARQCRAEVLQFAALCYDTLHSGTRVVINRYSLELANNAKCLSAGTLAKHDIHAVQKRGGSARNIELTTVGVFARVCRGQYASTRVSKRKVFVTCSRCRRRSPSRRPADKIVE
jgi:hypothetical protein